MKLDYRDQDREGDFMRGLAFNNPHQGLSEISCGNENVNYLWKSLFRVYCRSKIN